MSRFVSVILCFTVVSMTGTDLNTGMVVCFDDRGNFAIEASACKACARARGGVSITGTTTPGSTRITKSCTKPSRPAFDVRVEQAWRPSARADELQPSGPTAVIASIIATANQKLATVPAEDGVRSALSELIHAT